MSLFGTGAMGRVVRSGVGRRRAQTLVIAVATMMAVASAVVAGALMVAAAAPFDDAFKKQQGAHITAQFDPAKANAAQLAETGEPAGVTASSGPYPSTAFRPVDQAGFPMPTLTLVGRSGPDGDVDRVELKSGRWAQKPGEIVLSASIEGPSVAIGATLEASDTADAPTLSVVGFAVSAGRSADAWATPAQVDALAALGNPATSQMLYRFDTAGTKKQILAHRAELAASVESGALLGTQSWLDTKRAADQGAAATVPFVMAFGVLGIVMSVIIVSSVISGAVGTSLRRIGILKAIGFTPREVVRAYVAQALIPAGAGIAVGVVLGNLLAVPLLAESESVYGAVSLSVAWWVDVAVPAAALLVVGLAALIPALRAGRLHTVEAIAVGRAPRTGRGQWAHRVLGRLPLPRPVTYGLATPFTHPVRALAMLLAVAFGTIAATFAVGLTSSLGAVGASQDPESRAAVTVATVKLNNTAPPPPPVGGAAASPSPVVSSPAGTSKPKVADPAKVRAAVKSEAGLESYYGKLRTEVAVAGVSGSVEAGLYEGDSRSGSYEMLSGHWITGKGQVVVPSRFLERTSTKVGDTVRMTYEQESADLRIVGESFDTSGNELEVHADMANFPAAEPSTFLVEVKSDVSADEFAQKLAAVVRPLGGDATTVPPAEQKSVILVMDAMAVLLTLMLVSVAGLGVLNSVVLDTRERVHDLGVCKAIGMSPRQTVSLVLASVSAIGVIGGLLGVPVGYMLHGIVMPVMGRAVGTGMPSSVLDVYGPVELLLLGLGGVVLAVLGAMLPAGWAARARTATALRTE
ncbi:ABC transporter permease [Streptomyces resistomycificus]|uniref:Efflux ABC transporter, permease n=1 Tax=Streptomyces resistomycificus TaxID=67356 RepID=A0A0L8KQ63_9ACTN|nr:FtsX-like permease family protein [Streptomyces resistomycificus]KOG27859.1 efflux ABC transporter, permease [Streptomyces resistomycificus]KUN95440.1 ABC transporter permease [Streptomyces resistomycificus]